ncbi:MAG: mannosyltransferase [Chitinophagaceae bacterium]|jgi:glycosyltransferase involved in cell wall biosynthesis
MPNSGKQQVHIISSDVPFPADYGGMIDVFYTIKELSESGIEIYLHCFQYGRGSSAELEKHCEKVWYYPRKTGLPGFSLSLPYMMYSRRAEELLPNLLINNAPILFEGIHCCYLLNHPALAGRKKILRNQNVEQQYYTLLARRTSGILRKIYFKVEALLLRRFESKLENADALAPISERDTLFFENLYPDKKVIHIAGFHPFEEVISKEGSGTYCLYHGNLGHPENIEVALYLIENVFKGLEVPFIIAGRNPDQKIIDACKQNVNIQLVENPGENAMSELIRNAHINVMPTFQESGLKLKLLYALYSGRFVLVNQSMLYGTGLDEVCVVAENDIAFRQKINDLMGKQFLSSDIEQRKAVLSRQYDNKEKAKRLNEIIKSQD